MNMFQENCIFTLCDFTAVTCILIGN